MNAFERILCGIIVAVVGAIIAEHILIKIRGRPEPAAPIIVPIPSPAPFPTPEPVPKRPRVPRPFRSETE